jgi:hypothetical protein
MEEKEQELKPKRKARTVRKETKTPISKEQSPVQITEKRVENPIHVQITEKRVENPIQVQTIEQKPQITQQIRQSCISDVEVAKKLINIYQSAQDRKLQFNLSFEYVRRMLEYKTCYYTNKIFTEDGPNARSFDRIDSEKGYIEGNVVACTIDINGKKSNLSFEEISCIYLKLVKKKTKETPKKTTENTIVAKETPIVNDEFFSLDSKDK